LLGVNPEAPVVVEEEEAEEGEDRENRER